jgi:type IV pilus assembly protein PilB
MDKLKTFLESLRGQIPAQVTLIDARATMFKGEPMLLLKDLLDRSVLPKGRLLKLWADALGVAYVNPASVEIPVDSYEQLPVDIARKVGAIVLNSLGDNATVAMADPLNARQVESLGKILGRNISPVFAHPDEIATVINMYLGSEGNIAANLQSVCDQLPGMLGAREIKSAADVADLVDSKAVIELLNSIILTAYRRRASDIHFET